MKQCIVFFLAFLAERKIKFNKMWYFKQQKALFGNRHVSGDTKCIYGISELKMPPVSTKCFVVFVHARLRLFSHILFGIEGQTGCESQEYELATDTVSTSNTHEKPKTTAFYILLQHWEQFGLFPTEISSLLTFSICSETSSLKINKV